MGYINGVCNCRDGYIKWKENGLCYQPFTQGPCKYGEMLDVKVIIISYLTVI